MDVWEDPILGHGGDYGFGGAGGGGGVGYAFGVTNQGARLTSFYSPTLLEPANDAQASTILQPAPRVDIVTKPPVDSNETSVVSAQSTMAPPAAQRSTSSLIGPVLLVIAAIVILK